MKFGMTVVPLEATDLILLNTLQSVITTWQIHKLVR